MGEELTGTVGEVFVLGTGVDADVVVFFCSLQLPNTTQISRTTIEKEILFFTIFHIISA